MPSGRENPGAHTPQSMDVYSIPQAQRVPLQVPWPWHEVDALQPGCAVRSSVVAPLSTSAVRKLLDPYAKMACLVLVVDAGNMGIVHLAMVEPPLCSMLVPVRSCTLATAAPLLVWDVRLYRCTLPPLLGTAMIAPAVPTITSLSNAMPTLQAQQA